MSLGEQVILRIVLVLLLCAVVFCFRLVVALIKKGFAALTGKGGKAKATVHVPVPPAPPIQTPEPPVQTLVTPEPPPAVPEYPVDTVPPMMVGSYEDLCGVTPRRQPCIQALNGPYQDRTFPLNGYVTIGRNPASVISFPPETPGISGNHCVISLYPSTAANVDYEVLLMDVGSTYGTYLADGQRLEPRQQYRLMDGAVFFLGGRDGCAFLVQM